MKKIPLLILAIALYQNWGKIDRLIHKPPPSQNYGEVVLYETDWCPYCKATRKLFESRGVAYQAVDIEKSDQGAKIYRALGGEGIPFIDINGTLIRGYDEEKILKALKL